MFFRHAILIVTAALSFSFPSLAHSQQATEAGTIQKHSIRPIRQIIEPKTFPPAVVEFLQQPIASHLVTINPNGGPQVTIMWFKYEDGALLFTTTTDRIKFRNMQKDPRAVLTVMDPTNMYKWVTVHGKLSIDNREPAAFYRGLAEHYLTGDSLAAWKETAVMDKRTVLKLTPTHIRAMGFPQQ
jgi:PPOX class probable F420-dependent enzyme